MTATVKSLSAQLAAAEQRLHALEEAVNTLRQALLSTTEQAVEAHVRLDKAGEVVRGLMKPLRAKPEPSTTIRLPRAQFDAALASLRGASGGREMYFARDRIIAHALQLAAGERDLCEERAE